jgi:hypothetical protein
MVLGAILVGLSVQTTAVQKTAAALRKKAGSAAESELVSKSSPRHISSRPVYRRYDRNLNLIRFEECMQFGLYGDLVYPFFADDPLTQPDVDDLSCLVIGYADLSLCPNSDIFPCEPGPCALDAECSASVTGARCINGACRCADNSDCPAVGSVCNANRQGGRCELVDVDDLVAEVAAFGGTFACKLCIDIGIGESPPAPAPGSPCACKLCAQVCPWDVITMVPTEEVLKQPKYASLVPEAV